MLGAHQQPAQPQHPVQVGTSGPYRPTRPSASRDRSRRNTQPQTRPRPASHAPNPPDTARCLARRTDQPHDGCSVLPSACLQDLPHARRFPPVSRVRRHNLADRARCTSTAGEQRVREHPRPAPTGRGHLDPQVQSRRGRPPAGRTTPGSQLARCHRNPARSRKSNASQTPVRRPERGCRRPPRSPRPARRSRRARLSRRMRETLILNLHAGHRSEVRGRKSMAKSFGVQGQG